MRLMEENNALRAGIRDLVSAPELAPFRSRTPPCVLSVSAVEVRGIAQREAAASTTYVPCCSLVRSPRRRRLCAVARLPGRPEVSFRRLVGGRAQ